jgi:hypothetical protein
MVSGGTDASRGLDSKAIVSHGKDPFIASVFRRRDVYMRDGGTAVFDYLPDEVVKGLDHLRIICRDGNNLCDASLRHIRHLYCIDPDIREPCRFSANSRRSSDRVAPVMRASSDSLGRAINAVLPTAGVRPFLPAIR